MRTSMLWTLVGATSLVACVAVSLCRGPAMAQEAPAARSAAVSDETVKDVEVMRRVLVREALSSRAAATTDASSVYVAHTYSLWGVSESASEAFVVPGQGATILLRTSDAVAPGQSEEDAASTPEKPSAWDEEAAALEGKSLDVPAARRRVARYDAAKVEALRTRVLDVLAKYGHRLRGLSSGDRITVLVVGGGGASVEPQVVSVNDGGSTAYRALVTAMGRGGDGGRTTLSIHVSVADCQAAASGSMSAEEFRRRAVVAAY